MIKAKKEGEQKDESDNNLKLNSSFVDCLKQKGNLFIPGGGPYCVFWNGCLEVGTVPAVLTEV